MCGTMCGRVHANLPSRDCSNATEIPTTDGEWAEFWPRCDVIWLGRKERPLDEFGRGGVRMSESSLSYFSVSEKVAGRRTYYNTCSLSTHNCSKN